MISLSENIHEQCKDKTFLVTGGAGFIGSEVVKQIILSKGNVIVLDNFSSGKKKYIEELPRLKILKGNIKNNKTVNLALKNCDYVINLASLPFIPDSYFYPQEFFNVNANGTINLIMECIKQRNVKNFVHISTSEVYGTAKKNPMNEQHPTLPHSTYAVSKLAGERAVFTIHKEHDFPVVIIRPFNSYGPNITQPYIIPEIGLQLLKSNQIKLGNVESQRDFTFVSDTASGMIKSLFSDNAIGETINLGSNKTYKIKKLVSIMATIIGKKPKIIIDKKRFRPYDVDKLICDNTKSKKILNWEPQISINEGLEKTIKWIKTNKIEFNTPFEGWSRNYRKQRGK
jgi:dTDP-glucose 4,6-dehydratase